jgi:dCMP deaminase
VGEKLADVKRPSKDEYYIGIAESVCKRSPCIRRQFGAIIVREDAVVSTGYNGPARGVINCLQAGCLKDEKDIPSYEGYDHCPAVHAEENSIINAARNGSRVRGGTLYLAGQDYETGEPIAGKPCDRCKRTIINAGIEQVVTRNSEGTLIKKDVSDWVSRDTENYLQQLDEARE